MISKTVKTISGILAATTVLLVSACSGSTDYSKSDNFWAAEDSCETFAKNQGYEVQGTATVDSDLQARTYRVKVQVVGSPVLTCKAHATGDTVYADSLEF